MQSTWWPLLKESMENKNGFILMRVERLKIGFEFELSDGDGLGWIFGMDT